MLCLLDNHRLGTGRLLSGSPRAARSRLREPSPISLISQGRCCTPWLHWWPSAYPLLSVNSSLVWHSRCCLMRVKGNSPFPWSLGYACLDTARYAVSLYGYQGHTSGSCSAYGPQVLLTALLAELVPRGLVHPGAGFCICPFQFQEAPLDPFLQPVWVPVKGSPTLKPIDPPFGVWNPDKGTVCLLLQVTLKLFMSLELYEWEVIQIKFYLFHVMRYTIFLFKMEPN